MKSKITTFIMIVFIFLILASIIVFSIILYQKITATDVVNSVKDFVSDISITPGENTKQSTEVVEIIGNNFNGLEDTYESEKTASSKVNRYYYNQLDEYAKIIYDAIDKNKEAMKSGTYEIDLGNQFLGLLSQYDGEKLLGQYYQSAIETYTYDNTDVFYLNLSNMFLNIETTTRGNRKSYKVVINSGDKSNYLNDNFSSKEQVNQAIEEIEKVREYFVVNKKSDAYSNIKIVHDFLVDSIDYDSYLSQSNIYDIYGALVNKKSVCEGYAKSFKYLMDSLEIPCVFVIGKGTNSDGKTENHSWNYVQIDGIWYAVDVTWDDPIVIGGGKASNTSKYKYFLKGETEFNQTHMPEMQFTEGGKYYTYPDLNKNNYKR